MLIEIPSLGLLFFTLGRNHYRHEMKKKPEFLSKIQNSSIRKECYEVHAACLSPNPSTHCIRYGSSLVYHAKQGPIYGLTEILIRIATTQKFRYIKSRGNKMAAKIKPVELAVIKDKKIVREVIAQVRRKPAAEDVKWAKHAGNCLTN